MPSGQLDAGHELNMVVSLDDFKRDPNSHLYTSAFGLEGEHLLRGINSTDHGFLNTEDRGITGISCHNVSGAPGGPVGISFSHGEIGESEIPLNTEQRTLHVDAKTGEAAAYHIVHDSSSGTNVHPAMSHVAIDPSKLEAFDDVIRRASRWADLDPSNVTTGLERIEHVNPDGSSVVRHIVSKTDEDGNYSAIHRLIELNKDGPNASTFCDGSFHSSKRITLPGDRYVISDSHLNQVTKSLTDALTTPSNWKKGLNVRVFTEKKPPTGTMSLSLQVRNPISPTVPLQAN